MTTTMVLKEKILNSLYSPDCVDETDWAIQLSEDELNKVEKYLEEYITKNKFQKMADGMYLLFDEPYKLSIFYDPEFDKFIFNLHNWVDDAHDVGFVHFIAIPKLSAFVKSMIHDD